MSDLAATLEGIRSAGRDELVQRWTQAFGNPPPKHIQAGFMRAAIAWRAQLDAQSAAGVPVNLAKLQRSLRAAKAPPPLAPGARLVREWEGKTHTVIVQEKGFGYAGKHYRSLSAIARNITGTPWSGPAFFGLKR